MHVLLKPNYRCFKAIFEDEVQLWGRALSASIKFHAGFVPQIVGEVRTALYPALIDSYESSHFF